MWGANCFVIMFMTLCSNTLSLVHIREKCAHTMDVCTVHVDLPMNEPVLQIRLKKQLSGGRVPHLLQTENKYHDSATVVMFFSNTLNSWSSASGGQLALIPHIPTSRLWLFTSCTPPLFYEWEMFEQREDRDKTWTLTELEINAATSHILKKLTKTYNSSHKYAY